MPTTDALPREQGATRRTRSFSVGDFFATPKGPKITPNPTRPGRFIAPPRPGDIGIYKPRKPPAFRPTLPPGAGRKFLRLVGRASPIGRGVDVLEVLLPMLQPGYGTVPAPFPIPNPANGWSPCTPVCAANGVPDTTAVTNTCGSPALLCVAGQALSGGNWKVIQVKPTWLKMGYWRTGTSRGNHVQSFSRASAAVNVAPALVNTTTGPTLLFPEPMLDPNVAGQIESLPAPDLVPGFASPLKPFPELQANPQTHPVLALTEAMMTTPWLVPAVIDWLNQQPAPNTGVEPFPGTGPGSGWAPPLPGHSRAPVKKPAKESNKTRGPVAVGIALLDSVSEWSEVVDAAFEALPKAVQKKWKKKARNDSQFLDNAGQFGIDGADWKLAAVFHNVDKLDPVEFIKNVIANQIEDHAIGMVQRGIPRNSINAFEPGEKAYNDKIVKPLLQYLGLEEEDEDFLAMNAQLKAYF